MENKDVEKRLQESADNIEVREFSAVWENIKDRVDCSPARKKRTPRWLPTAVASIACGVVICAVVVPLALQNTGDKPIVDDSSTPIDSAYLDDDFSLESATLEEFVIGLATAEIDCFDYSKYVVAANDLYKTPQAEVKGGRLEVTDEGTMYLNIQLYAEDVRVTDYETMVYDQIYTVGETVFEYKLKESVPEDSFYIYEIKTEYAGTQYFMEYTCMTQDITSFLSSFFE